MSYLFWIYIVVFVVALPALYIDMATDTEKFLNKSLEWNPSRFLSALILTIMWPLFIIFVLFAKFIWNHRQ